MTASWTSCGAPSPRRAIGALQVYVSHLRRALEPDRAPGQAPTILVTRAPGYVLQLDPAELDASRFEAGVEAGGRLLREGRASEAHDALAGALALWRGPALAEFAFDSFASPEAARLDQLRARANEDRLAADLALGRSAEAVAELEMLVAEWPLRERLWELLIVALYRSGRQADALRAYARIRESLAEELGLQPGPALRRLEADVLDQASSLDWQPSAPPPARGPAGTEGSAASAAAQPGGPNRLDPFVGRQPQLDLVEDAWQKAGKGSGQVVFVAGEPGIGKTRLVEEVVARVAGPPAGRRGAARAASGETLVAWGRVDEGEGTPPFWLWVQVIRALVEVADRDLAAAALVPIAGDIAHLVPEIKELMGELPPPPPLDPAAARFQLFEAVTALLLRLSEHQLVVVVLDDLQWADPPSLALTAHLAARIENRRVLLLATYRDVDPVPTAELLATLGVVVRQAWVSEVVLAGLTNPEVARYLSLASGSEPSPEAVATVWARTNGNPFFVGELARLAASEGRADGPGAAGPAVPRAVLQVIRRRLGRLPAETNRMLALATVAGHDFDLRVVASAAGTDLDGALDSIDLAVARGVVVEDRSAVGRFHFSHALVHDAIYGEISALRRARLHAQVGEALVRVWHERAVPTELAHHFYQATTVLGPKPAISAAVAAATAAHAALAYESAEQFLQRALALVQDLPSRARARSARAQCEGAAGCPLHPHPRIGGAGDG